MAETTGQRLIQCAQIIQRALPVRTSDGETAVLRLFRDRVFEHHHGRYLERAADCVGNVVAFNAQRRLFKPKSLRHIVHRIGTCAHIADTAHLLRANACLALSLARSISCFLSPLLATRMVTAAPRNPLSHCSSPALRDGSIGTITSREQARLEPAGRHVPSAPDVRCVPSWPAHGR